MIVIRFPACLIWECSPREESKAMSDGGGGVVEVSVGRDRADASGRA